MQLSKKWKPGRSGTLRRSQLGKISGTLGNLYKETNQNKREIRIARRLGGSLTRGSGSVNSDADIRTGKFLIEHKERSKGNVSLPYQVYEKVREQADKRDLIPVVIVTDGTLNDFVIMSAGDTEWLYDSPVDKAKITYKQIHVSFDEFITYAYIAKNHNALLCPIDVISDGKTHHLCVSTLPNFQQVSTEKKHLVKPI